MGSDNLRPHFYTMMINTFASAIWRTLSDRIFITQHFTPFVPLIQMFMGLKSHDPTAGGLGLNCLCCFYVFLPCPCSCQFPANIHLFWSVQFSYSLHVLVAACLQSYCISTDFYVKRHSTKHHSSV